VVFNPLLLSRAPYLLTCSLISSAPAVGGQFRPVFPRFTLVVTASCVRNLPFR
jgi:hypothetical protein